MSRDLAQRAHRRGERLPAAYWTAFENVCLPGRLDRLDLVVVGPSGVHVVARCASPAPAARGHAPGEVPGDVPADVTEAARRAATASQVLGILLPDRYRRAVTPAVRLDGQSEVGLSVAGVFTASPDVLRHAWLHGPRVLSTSEARAVAEALRAHLRPMPVPASPRRAGWRRHPRRWLGGVAGLAAAAAAVAADVPTPWGIG
jgi:hypothetical protein